MSDGSFLLCTDSRCDKGHTCERYVLATREQHIEYKITDKCKYYLKMK